MDPLTAGLITGGANLLGSMFSSDTSAKNTQMQIAASEQQQATQNAFTQQMSSTAYQRASQDMKAAGLNPMMMFGSGGAASTPGGSSIQAPMPQTTNKFAGIGNAVASTVNTAVQAQTFDKMTQEIANLQTQQAKTAAETATEQKKPALLSEETQLAHERAWDTSQSAAQKANAMPEFRLRGLSAEAIESMPPWLRDNAIRAGFLGQKAGDVLSPIVSSAVGAGRVAKGFSDNSFRNRYYFGE